MLETWYRFRLTKKFLRPGYYSWNPRTSGFSKSDSVTKFFSRAPKGPLFFSESRGGSYHKSILSTDDVILFVMPMNSSRSIRLICRNYDQMGFVVPKIICRFMHGFACERISGVIHFDADHRIQAATQCLRRHSNKMQKRFIGAKLVFQHIQHGDMHAQNLMWNGDTPSLIDFEAMDYYPLLFDFFTCLFNPTSQNDSMESQFRLFGMVLEGFLREEIERYLSEFNVSYSVALLDQYLSFWVLSYARKARRMHCRKKTIHQTVLFKFRVLETKAEKIPIASRVYHRFGSCKCL